MASPRFTVQQAADAACTWCGKPASAVPAVVGVAARAPLICSECVGLVNGLANAPVGAGRSASRVPRAAAAAAPPRELDAAARAEAERTAAEVAERLVELVGDRDPREVFRCSYCDAYRTQRKKLVPAMTALAFICERCSAAAATVALT